MDFVYIVYNDSEKVLVATNNKMINSYICVLNQERYLFSTSISGNPLDEFVLCTTIYIVIINTSHVARTHCLTSEKQNIVILLVAGRQLKSSAWLRLVLCYCYWLLLFIVTRRVISNQKTLVVATSYYSSRKEIVLVIVTMIIVICSY